MLGIISKIRRKAYGRGILKRINLSTNVVSVGNLSFGGTGKTPFVIYLLKFLRGKNISVAIVVGTYKSPIKDTTIAFDGRKICQPSHLLGDEMQVLARNSEFPIIASPRKYLGAIEAEEKFNPQLILIDDGFQHLKLRRSLDIVILDKQTIMYPRAFPFGRLREPVSALKFADIVAVPCDIELPIKFQRVIKGTTVIKFKKEQDNFLYDYNDSKIPLDGDLLREELIAVSGIAHNRNFFEQIEQRGFLIADCFSYPDHFRYKYSDVKNIIKACKKLKVRRVITTEKDFVKLKEFSNVFFENDVNLYYIKVFIKITEGEELFHNILLNLIRNE